MRHLQMMCYWTITERSNWQFISVQDPEERNTPEYRRRVRSQAARRLDHRLEAKPLPSQASQATQSLSNVDVLMSDEDHYACHAFVASMDSYKAFITGGVDPFTSVPSRWKPFFAMAMDHCKWDSKFCSRHLAKLQKEKTKFDSQPASLHGR